jgi:hypothetical protein
MASCDTPNKSLLKTLQQWWHQRHERPEEDNYEPLPTPRHIRLLRLAPGNSNAPIRCSLVQVSLDSRPSYEAISYAWGDSTDRVQITCHNKTIAITRNLHEALLVFRHPLETRDLWADAICINQQDTTERSAQVQLMARIYSEASKVLLWLGKEEPEIVHAAFDFIRRFMNQRFDELSLRDETSWRSILMQIEDHAPYEAIRLLDENIVANFKRLVLCPVFQRGWVRNFLPVRILAETNTDLVHLMFR